MIKWSTTDQAKVHGVKCLVYSEAGVGKTVLCSTAPSPLILSAEAGLLSLRRVRIPVIEIKTIADLYEAYEWCLKSKEASQFYTICCDSISEIAEVVLADCAKRAKDPRQAYGEMIQIMSGAVRAFRDLPGKCVYMTAKMEHQKDEVSGAVKWGPSVPGQKLGPALPYYFDEVFRLGVSGSGASSYRFLQTGPDLQYTAKDRSGALQFIEQPDLTVVFTKIVGG